MKKFFASKKESGFVLPIIGLRIVQWGLTLFFQYIVAIISCIYAVPLFCAFIASATGANTSSSLISVMTLWVFPSVLSTLIIFVATLFIFKFIYKKFKDIFDKKIESRHVISA